MKAQKSWFSTGDLIGFFTLKIPERKAQTKYAEYKNKGKAIFFMCRRECVDIFYVFLSSSKDGKYVDARRICAEKMKMTHW